MTGVRYPPCPRCGGEMVVTTSPGGIPRTECAECGGDSL